MELVPMSMAAMRMEAGGVGGACPLHRRYILPRQVVDRRHASASWANPTMNRSVSRPTRLMLEGRAKALKQHLPKAIEGDGIGVHHARVASRRLREIVPV